MSVFTNSISDWVHNTSINSGHYDDHDDLHAM